MRTLNICDVGLPTDAARAFNSMLDIVQRHSIASWRSSSLNHADVLLSFAEDGREAGDAWRDSGKPAIMVIDHRAEWPAAPFVLSIHSGSCSCWPFSTAWPSPSVPPRRRR